MNKWNRDAEKTCKTEAALPTAADLSFCLGKDQGDVITGLCGHSELKGDMAAEALVCEESKF